MRIVAILAALLLTACGQDAPAPTPVPTNGSGSDCGCDANARTHASPSGHAAGDRDCRRVGGGQPRHHRRVGRGSGAGLR